MTSTTTMRESVAETLRAAGHHEALPSTGYSGFTAFTSGSRVIVVPCLDEHMEGHWDSPGHHAAQARMAGEYRQQLEDAGWAVRAHPSGELLAVAGRAKAA